MFQKEKRKRSWSRYFDKVKADGERYDKHKERDRLRKRETRKKQVLSQTQLEEKRLKCRLRVQRHRLKNKTSRNDNKGEEHSVYKSVQALGKAVKRVKVHLPNSPRRKSEVIRNLASAHGMKVKKVHKENGNKKLPESTVRCVQEFYLLDSISRQAPGMRDYVIQRSNGKKAKLQKRHLIWSLKDTYALFKSEHSDIEIGLSKFCSLRPSNVLLSSATPRNVCLCQHHDNIRLLCDCLSKEISSFPCYSNSFVDSFVCDVNSETCMTGNCKNCPDFMTTLRDEASLDEETTWHEWERVTVDATEKPIKKMVKVQKEGTVDEALQSLEAKMPPFLQHVFVKRSQAKFFEEKVQNCKPEEAIVHVDFSENYTCMQQDEIQAAHWHQQQITLFPVAIWTRDSSGNIVCTSHVIVSNDLSHEKKSISVFLDTVLNTFVKLRHPDVTEVFLFSDGPSSQFKNKFMVSLLRTFNQQLGLRISWHYFATSHGKGAVDGIGAAVKRSVWTAVSTRKVESVIDAKAFADVAKRFSHKVDVTLITAKEIQVKCEELMLDKCFDEATVIPGISKFHCMYVDPNKPNEVKCLLHSYKATAIETFDDTILDDKGVCSEDDSESCTEGPSDPMFHVEEDAEKDDKTPESPQVDFIYTKAAHQHGILIQPGIPYQFCDAFHDVCSDFTVPQYNLPYIQSIVRGDFAFKGNYLISNSDLVSLYAVNCASNEDKWLSNFVIDSYMQLVKSEAQSSTTLSVELFTWEEFSHLVGSKHAQNLVQQKKEIMEQDLILIPCNTSQTGHWFLLAAYPKLKHIITLDSMSSKDNSVKQTATDAIQKMFTFLCELDSAVNNKEWKFYASVPTDVPQQRNNFDCGVFVCLFARCLALGAKMLMQPNISAYRKYMVLELQEEMLHPIPPSNSAICGNYYAVDYVDKFYIGRALEAHDNQFVEFKFLHKTGAVTFDWPRRDDVECIHSSCIFFGPIKLQGVGPFYVHKLSLIEKIFKNIKSK